MIELKKGGELAFNLGHVLASVSVYDASVYDIEKEEVGPYQWVDRPVIPESLYVKVFPIRDQGKSKEALASVEKICKEINPNFPVSIQFMDDE